MPTIAVCLDPDQIYREILKITHPSRDRPYAWGDLGVTNKRKIEALADEIFSNIFGLVKAVLIKELKFVDSDFELKATFVGRFDQNFLPISIDIIATQKPVWFYPGDEYEIDLEKRRRKQKAIAEATEAAVKLYMKERHEQDWKMYVWTHLSEGYFKPSD